MKLTGFVLYDNAGPVTDCYVQIGELTAVIGANDAGKSRLVRTFASILESGEADPPTRAAIFAEFTDEETRRLLWHLEDVDLEMRPFRFEAAVRSFLAAIRHQSGLQPATVDSLRNSRAFAFVPGSESDTTDWTVYWCTLEAPERQPTTAFRLGTIPLWWLPTPLIVPASNEQVVAAATRAISWLVDLLDWPEREVPWLRDQLDEFKSLVPGLVKESLRSRQPAAASTRTWLDHGGGLRDEVVKSFTLIEGATRASLPKAIRDRYRINVAQGPVGGRESPFRYAVASSDSGDPFPVESLADGWRLWVTLALLAGIEALRTRTSSLHAVFDRWLTLIEELFELEANAGISDEFEDVDPTGPRETLLASVADDARQVKVAIQQVAAQFPEVRDRWLEACLESLGELSPSGPIIGSELARAPFYLIDEPERHLHPLAQRQLSGWLGELARTRATQALIVTHSVPFIAQADRLVYVRRASDGRATVESIQPTALTALTEVAIDLGLDRGELLAAVGVFLFVEGVSDQHVLEGLYGDRLRRMGVAVIPIHGVTRQRQLVDMQVVTRFSTARIAVMFDDLSDSEVTRLITDDEFRSGATKSPKTELRELAILFDSFHGEGRDLTPLPLHVADIFFVLDDEAVRSVFNRYPGHDEAKATFSAIAKGSKWKEFLQRRYDIPKHEAEWYRRAAESMRHCGIFPSELETVLEQLELLTQDWVT